MFDASERAKRRPRQPPPYTDHLIRDFDQFRMNRYNHLGHWDEPDEVSPDMDLSAAQGRMLDHLLAMTGIGDDRCVLDVGCGVGGTLETIDRTFNSVRLVGLDVDERQLSRCRSLQPRAGNSYGWIRSDAVHLPFDDATFHHILSIEAMWHFESRASFLVEAARVLRTAGTLGIVDIYVDLQAARTLGCSPEELHEELSSGFTPWPEFGSTPEETIQSAAHAGLTCTARVDATHNTLPTYLDHGDADRRPASTAFSATKAVRRFVDLHRRHLLGVWYLAFEKRPA